MEIGVSTMKEMIKERGESNKYNQAEIIYIIKDLIEAFLILENAGIANRDVKPDNFILVNKKNEGYKYKVSDFGIGIIVNNIDKSTKVAFETILGISIEFSSPEVINYYYDSNADETELYDPFLSDVYSLGLIILNILGLGVQIMNKEKTQINNENVIEYRNKAKMLFPLNQYDFIFRLLEKMLQYDPSKRSRFQDLKDFIEKGSNKIQIHPPIEDQFFQKIEDKRNFVPNIIEKVKNSVNFARLYYNIGKIKEVCKYTNKVFQDVEYTENCYEIEIMKLKSLIFIEKGEYRQAQNAYKRYNGILKQYKQDVKYDYKENNESNKDKWEKGFNSLFGYDKKKIINKFWTIEEKIIN